MNGIKLVGFLLFLMVGCSGASNPVDQLTESKTADEVFVIFGKPLLLSCMDAKQTDQGKCNSEITDAVAAAQKNGYGNIKPEHFTPDVRARFFAKLEASLERGNKRNAQRTNRYPNCKWC